MEGNDLRVHRTVSSCEWEGKVVESSCCFGGNCYKKAVQSVVEIILQF